jgi:hypothetical protein
VWNMLSTLIHAYVLTPWQLMHTRSPTSLLVVGLNSTPTCHASRALCLSHRHKLGHVAKLADIADACGVLAIKGT